MGLGISTGCTQTIPDDINSRIEETGLKETFKDWTVRDVNEALIETEGFTNGEMKCGWREFFRICQNVKDRKDRAKLLHQRNVMHPACLSYAMISEPAEYSEDRVSETEKRENHLEEKEQDIQEDVFEMDKDLDEFISENEDDNEEEDCVSSTSSVSGDPSGRDRISSNVHFFSPVFFGYSTISSHEHDMKEEQRVRSQREAEESFEDSNKDTQSIYDQIKMLESQRDEWTSRQDGALQDREKRRERERRDMENSYHAQKRQVGEEEASDITLQYEKQVHEFEERIKSENETSQKTRERKLKSFSKQIRELELKVSKMSSSNDAILCRPRGNKLCEIYEKKLDEAALEWAERKNELKEKQLQIEEVGSSRGVKIMMKSAIEKCEKAVNEASQKMEKIRQSQELARSLARREAPFALLFEPLLNYHQQRRENNDLKPHTLMVFSTIIMFCGDSIRHKLDWFYWRFSESEIRRAEARSKPRSMRNEIEQQDATSSFEESRCSPCDIERLLLMTTRALESIGGVVQSKTISESQIRTLAVSFFDSPDCTFYFPSLHV